MSKEPHCPSTMDNVSLRDSLGHTGGERTTMYHSERVSNSMFPSRDAAAVAIANKCFTNEFSDFC